MKYHAQVNLLIILLQHSCDLQPVRPVYSSEAYTR